MEKMYLRAGILINGIDDTPLYNMAVKIVDGVILSVEKQSETPDGFSEIDYSNNIIMPGMINSHIHLGFTPNETERTYTQPFEFSVLINNQLDELLRSGVTYVRNQGTADYYDNYARDAVKNGTVFGPEVLSCGPAITTSDGHGRQFGIIAEGVEQCEQATKELISHGIDTIKIIATGGVLTEGTNLDSAQFSVEEIKAIVNVAKQHGMLTSAHCQGAAGMRNAVEAGVDTIEHGTFLEDDILENILKKDAWLVPTLTAPHCIKQRAEEGKIAKHIADKMAVVYDIRMASFKRAYKAGAKIAVGTDAGTPNNTFDKTWFELKMLVDNGMSEMEAIKAATSNCAKMLNIDKNYGSIDAGKYADIVVLSENPLSNIETIQTPFAVMKKGRLYK